MRIILFCSVLILSCVTGCGLLGDKRRCGAYAGIYLPALVNTETPVLTDMGHLAGGAHPVGTLAGPALEGRSIHGPIAPVLPMPMPMGQPPRTLIADPCAPSPGMSRLTVEEFIKLTQDLKAKGLPNPQ